MPTFRTPRSPHRFSEGPRWGRLIARKLGRITTPWQQYVLDVAGERVDGPGSPLAYPNVDLLVGRRCGKSVTELGVPLARALAGPITLDNGRVLPFTGTHIAQNLVKAKTRFMKDLVEPYQDTMSSAVWRAGVHLRAGLGDTELRLDPAVAGKDWKLRRASTITISPPTIASVRSDGLAHIGIDEFLVFTAAQGQMLMSAAGPTMGDLRGHAQMWRTSNISILNDAKTWAWEIRENGRALVEAGITSGTAYFEFTIPESADPADERIWWDYYPALADGIIRVEELREDLKRLGPESFAAEYLGRWPGEVLVAAWQAIAERELDGCLEQDAGLALPAPATVKSAIGVDVDPFMRSSSIAAATAHPDLEDTPFVEIIDDRPGNDWVAGAVRQLAPDVDAIGIDDYGPGHELIEELSKDNEIAAKIVVSKPMDFSAACFGMGSRIHERRIRIRKNEHYGTFRDAAKAAQRTTGKAWQWERRVTVSQTSLVAATLAPWALVRAPTPDEFFVY